MWTSGARIQEVVEGGAAVQGVVESWETERRSLVEWGEGEGAEDQGVVEGEDGE